MNTAAVQAVAKRLTNDRTPGRIDTSEEQLPDMATAVAEAQADGINPARDVELPTPGAVRETRRGLIKKSHTAPGI